MEVFPLWDNSEKDNTKIEWYAPKTRKTDAAVIIFPGGGYAMLANHEGEDYAKYLNSLGMTAFVVYYRVSPNRFPLPLLDARRAVRFVRRNCEAFGIDKNKICVMGSSAGGHLAALLSTYTAPLAGEGVDETDAECYIPNGQILCYPVVASDKEIAHIGSYNNLLGAEATDWENYDPTLLLHEKTPKAFIWHTANDTAVKVLNSYRYASALYEKGISCELHVFPFGPHGLGLAKEDSHVAQWTPLLKNWFHLHGLL